MEPGVILFRGQRPGRVGLPGPNRAFATYLEGELPSELENSRIERVVDFTEVGTVNVE